MYFGLVCLKSCDWHTFYSPKQTCISHNNTNIRKINIESECDFDPVNVINILVYWDSFPSTQGYIVHGVCCTYL